jgi:hypothetical protein
MRMLLSRACNPPLTLLASLRQWSELSQRLAEPCRRRRYQCEQS